jgi:hypothetical protein
METDRTPAADFAGPNTQLPRRAPGVDDPGPPVKEVDALQPEGKQLAQPKPAEGGQEDYGAIARVDRYKLLPEVNPDDHDGISKGVEVVSGRECGIDKHPLSRAGGCG